MESHPLPSTPAEARRIGAKRYFTGKPCKHGHVAERFTSDQSCCACKTTIGKSPEQRAALNAAVRRRRAANPEPYRERSRNWKRANPDKIRAQSRRARERNPEKCREA